ncbi:hypothetical protein GGR52DRAFT_571899 [Hypoxylon sp. FL1284]|nr:hypothetical protein GGR52DRAFT_571899 [Hypoxylon sp. FL1284]
MDPLSAFALAGNVLQFIEFATKLLSTGVQVYKSATGTADSNLAIEDISRNLSSLSSRLGTSDGGFRGPANQDALRSIANSCHADCDRLLTVLNDLKVKGGSQRAWKSFRAALKLAWKDEQEIDKLTSRLRDQQSAMTLHICAISKVSHISVVERNIAKEQAIIRSLDYHFRSSRYGGIAEAHARTFSWIFETSDGPNSRGSLLKWLRESDGVFWITGKPGSGKSTLMKYLIGHENTKDSLRSWAGPGRAIIASHFFWSSGSSIQTSVEGLLRSLLFNVFRQCPEIISEACPAHWEAPDISFAASYEWKFRDLLACIRTIKALSITSVRFCFFVDGLDEFDGDYTEIAQMLTEVADCSTIKLCVASRPLNEFQDQFGADVSRILRVHELTRDDTLKYSQSRLQAHPRWSVLGLDVQAAQSFLQKIADMAQGVFLWVTLVTQSLRNGLTNDDTIHMLDSVDPVYYRKSADLIQMQLLLTKGDRSLRDWRMPWLVALIHEREYADADYAITMSCVTPSDADIQSLSEKASRRLSAKGCGLLEIPVDKSYVEFIHRTAFDYLSTPAMVSYLQARSGHQFNASLSLLRAYVGCLKMGITAIVEEVGPVLQNDVYRSNEHVFWKVLFMATGARNDGADDAVIFKLIECLEDLSMITVDSTKKGKYVDPMNVWATPVGSLCGTIHWSAFVAALIRNGEAKFAAMRLSNDVDYFRRMPRPALWILMYGADPNAHISPFTTVWVDFVCLPMKHPSVITATDDFLEVLGSFFKYGADLGESAIGLTLNPSDTMSHLPFRMVTGWDTFCEALEDYVPSKTGRELEFAGHIAMKMIEQAIKVGWPMRRLPSVIESVFPERLRQPMLELIARGRGDLKNPSTNVKRRVKESAEGEGASKRLKH